MTIEELKDRIIEALNDMSDSDLYYLFNQYCEEAGYDDDRIEDMDNFDELFQGSAWDAVRAAYYGDFRPTDNYFIFNAYGNLVSFDYLTDKNSPYDEDQVADFIIDNENALDNSDIQDILDEYNESEDEEEFGESLKRKRPTRKLRVESPKRNRKKFRK